MRQFIKLSIIASLMLVGMGTAQAKETLSGPIQAEVVDVIDGDTIRVNAHLWLGLRKNIKIRFSGVQSPELHSAKCDYERKLAEKARAITTKAIAGKPVQLINVRYGKYSGRVVAEVLNHEGKNLNVFLFENALAQPSATGKRVDWCGHDNK